MTAEARPDEDTGGAVIPERRIHTTQRPLTATEEATLKRFATGSSREQIAQELHLAPSTIGHLLTSAKEKLGARTLPHAVFIFAQQINDRGPRS